MYRFTQPHLRSPSLRRFVVLAGLIGFLSVPAYADTPRGAADCEPRNAIIPAHTRRIERTITVPAVMGERCVPVHEEIVVPVYETQRAPRYRTIEVPVYETRMEPQYRTERVPRYEWRDESVRELGLKSTSITLPNPFACDCDMNLPFLPRPTLECKTEPVRVCVGYDTRVVPCGTKAVQHQVGTETKQVLDGYDTQSVQTGTRTERRVSGFRTETYEVCPASTRVVTECVVVPARAVMVVPDEHVESFEPISSSQVIGETAFARELEKVRSAATAS
jgi:hypothetical protein